MKLIVAIVPHASRKHVRKQLLAAELTLTQFDSVGGYLGRKSGTFLIGIEDGRVEEAIQLIHEASRSRVETVSAPVLSSTDVSEAVVASDAARVTAGGATVFVLPVDRFEKA